MTRPPVFLALALALAAVALRAGSAPDAVAPAAAVPVLTVTVTQPKMATLPLRLAANGNIAAWQEAIVSAESNGLRLVTVMVNVGDTVRRGQVLATFADAMVRAELAQGRAALAEAQAALDEAAGNARRARDLQPTGALSRQQVDQYLVAERAARARVDAARALSQTQALRLAQARVLAPDDGVVSARTATVGAVFSAGQELFRIFRAGRLEWRAEVAAPDLVRLRTGQPATLTPVGGQPIHGIVRKVAPAVDLLTRNGLVYVDMAAGSAARAGMFARGEINIGAAAAVLTLPQSALLQRDGFDYVMRVDARSKAVTVKVKLGRRVERLVEIVAGLDASSRVIASGAAFLGDGDLVRVVTALPGA